MLRSELLLLGIMSIWSIDAKAGTTNIWQIGKFDQSPVEFLSPLKDSVTYRAGQGNWRSDWPRSQGVGHPYTILFAIDSIQGLYTFRISTLIERPRVPVLRIEVNSHRGTFYLHPKLSYSRSDFSYAFDPHESQSEVAIAIPGPFLRVGQNAITITCIDDPASTPEEQKASGITFDALSLEQDSSREQELADISAELEPTIFYREVNGGLVEIVDAFIRTNRPARGGIAELQVEGKRYPAKLSDFTNFGEQRVSFELPEWDGTIPAKLKITAGSRRALDFKLRAERKWTIFVVPHTHLDVGYTDYQGKIAETQPRVLTQAAELIRAHPDFRFSMDGSWNLQQLLDTRPKEKQEEMLQLIRSGKMAMPAQYCNLLTGYASLETLYRSLYKSRELARRYGLPFEYANITDVPTYSGSYPSILASSGVKYWTAAANNDRAPIFYYDQWNEKSPFWWEGPDGKKVLFWYSRHYMQVQTLFGLPPQLAAVRQSLPIYLQAYSKATFKPDVALIFGTQVENTDLFPSTATFVDEWNTSYAYPKLSYSTFPGFFHYLEEHFGKDLPTYKGDGGPYWEDGIGSDSYFASKDRQNQNRALSAEILSSVTHSIDSNLNPPAGLLADIWQNIILFSEHTWLSYNSVSQPDHDQSIKQARVKDDRAERASLEIDDVMNRSLSQLADQIHIPSNTLIVFNSLNWSRDAVVETDLFAHPKVVDLSTHEDVPLQVLYEKQKFLHVRFIARSLPAVGYKCFSISYGRERSPKTERKELRTVDNRYYRIELDESTGSVARIYDKELKRELVNVRSPYKFGQYLYVTGGDGDTQMINPFPGLPPGELAVHPSSQGKLLGVEELPWGQSIRLGSSSVNTPEIQTEILLFNDRKNIEFRYHLHKNYTNDKEGVYFAFPLGMTAPNFAYGTQQGWVDPARDLMKGASLEWFNVQAWMAAHDSDMSVGIVPVDASLASFGDINRGKWPGDFRPRSGTIFSYVMNNYWHTNYRAGQGGDFEFRYALTSAAKMDGAALTKLATEEMRPVELDYVVDQDKVGNPDRPLPPEGKGFLETSAEGVVLVTWKRAEDGNGSILRLAETSGRAESAKIRFLHKARIRSAHICSGVEDNLEALPVEGNTVSLSFKPFEVLTVRVADE
jgi:alpha-mannosidase